MVDASSARSILRELSAFYEFLGRECGLQQAGACLRELTGDAVRRLEAALSNPKSFGMGKSILAAGRAAGFDIESKEGIEAWMQAMQSQEPAAEPKPHDEAAARKEANRRKAARRAGKKR